MQVSWPLILMFSKVYAVCCAVSCFQTQYNNCEKKIRGRSVDCVNQAHTTRNSSFYVKVIVLLYSPREGCRRLLCPVPLDKWHMQVARLSVLRVGRLYPRIDPETTNPV